MHESIADTGAQPGDTVRCLGPIKGGPNDVHDMPPRFLADRTYRVVSHEGTSCAHGGSDYPKTKSDPGWSVPWRGFGYSWEKV